jgi:hypothetical protein
MSQKSVEAIIGKLVTDEDLRVRLRTAPGATLRAFREAGLELTPVEHASLLALDPEACERFARRLDPRIQKVSLRATRPLRAPRRPRPGRRRIRPRPRPRTNR